MNRDSLDTYLNDHLAGSVTALEIIEHLAKTCSDAQLQSFFTDLHVEVTADQQVLQDILKALDMHEGAIRKAGAWLIEKVGRAKLGFEKEEAGGVEFLQALEVIVLGITGKSLLWRSLAAASDEMPQLRGPNYAELETRAMRQRDFVEAKRIAAARAAFRD